MTDASGVHALEDARQVSGQVRKIKMTMGVDEHLKPRGWFADKPVGSPSARLKCLRVNPKCSLGEEPGIEGVVDLTTKRDQVGRTLRERAARTGVRQGFEMAVVVTAKTRRNSARNTRQVTDPALQNGHPNLRFDALEPLRDLE
jgi:hypothetical protein